MSFKVGDRVRIIAESPKYGWGFARKGMIGTVNRLMKDAKGNNAKDGINPMRIYIKDLDRGRSNPFWNCVDDEIELVNANATPSP